MREETGHCRRGAFGVLSLLPPPHHVTSISFLLHFTFRDGEEKNCMSRLNFCCCMYLKQGSFFFNTQSRQAKHCIDPELFTRSPCQTRDRGCSTIATEKPNLCYRTSHRQGPSEKRKTRGRGVFYCHFLKSCERDFVGCRR